MLKKKFIFNDESIKNSYGFYIKTAGIDTRRFSQNPICLADHYNCTGNVIGTWEELQTTESLLMGSPNFDTKTHEELVRQVDNGTIKACSMGILFNETDFIRNENGDLILTKCELMEVSIVAVPSNANSIALYHQNGNRMSEGEISSLCLALQSETEPPENVTQNNIPTMKKIQLSVLAFVALGFAKTTKEIDEAELDEAVLGLKTKIDEKELELTRLKAEVQAYKEAEQLKQQQAIENLVNLAVQEGRITADKKQTFVDLAAQNLELAKATLESFPKKVDLKAGMKTPNGLQEPMTEEKFQALNEEQQLAWKNQNPDEYQNLFS